VFLICSTFLMTPTEIAMQKPLIAVLIASAFLTLNAQAADLLQVYQQALANDATYASARSSLAAGQERITRGAPACCHQRPAAAICAITASSSRQRRRAGRGGRRGDAVAPRLPHQHLHGVADQPLFNWGAWQTYQQSKLSQATAEALSRKPSRT
jgi:outer membrane protein